MSGHGEEPAGPTTRPPRIRTTGRAQEVQTPSPMYGEDRSPSPYGETKSEEVVWDGKKEKTKKKSAREASPTPWSTEFLNSIALVKCTCESFSTQHTLWSHHNWGDDVTSIISNVWDGIPPSRIMQFKVVTKDGRTIIKEQPNSMRNARNGKYEDCYTSHEYQRAEERTAHLKADEELREEDLAMSQIFNLMKSNTQRLLSQVDDTPPTEAEHKQNVELWEKILAIAPKLVATCQQEPETTKTTKKRRKRGQARLTVRKKSKKSKKE